jgi:phage replication-related protein YjqB (UPF0714/DUF867 family)
MPQDRFQNFSQLRKELVRGIDYDICVTRRDSPVAIIAPHGGKIEAGTSQIARAIAGDDYSLYLFEGLICRPHHEIHITSHKFDEPCCVKLVSQCDVIVAIHGRKDKTDKKSVYLGGLDIELRNAISEQLKQKGFPTQCHGHQFPGKCRMNICNRGRREAGVQLELPRSLRDMLSVERDFLVQFSGAVRTAIVSAVE